MTKVKICGNTNIDDVRVAKDAGADFIGFIFTESKRKISVKLAQEIITATKPFDGFVGVFANQDRRDVETIASDLGLKWLQFHGDETSRYCHSFEQKGYKVIKTFHIKDALSFKRIEEYNVTAYLFDTYTPEKLGGSGKKFDWSVIQTNSYVHDRLFLAGGLTVDNVKDAIQQIKPYAVDVASGVESKLGIKNHDLVRQFIQIAKGVPVT